jgi:outer membrane protein TolC
MKQCKLKYYFVLFIFLFQYSFLHANDSLKVLGLDDFISMVLKHHPVAKQADLITEMARQNLVVARGGFDPYFFSNLDQKRYDSEEYFFLNESGLKVPTWYGIELKGSYNINRGTQLNPENFIPVQGQAMIGISAPIGQGLFTDERRTALNQAKIFKQASEFERISMLNDLLFRVTKDYWEWALHYNNYSIYKNAITVAEERFSGFKNSFRLGDIPAIDTLEAFIQLQNLQFILNDALMQYRNATFMLSNHLWTENEIPVELTDAFIPLSLDSVNFSSTLTMDSVDNILNAIAQRHPDIQQLQLRIKQLDLERKLKLEYIKPKVNFNYNLLSEKQFTFNTEPTLANVFNNNYKWGFDIAFPLFWSKGRGEYKLAKLKIQDAAYKLDLKNIEITNKIQSYFNELLILKNQVALYEDATENYNKLLIAETIKFQTGESSMFLINARQMKLLEFESKLIEVKSKYLKALAGVAWSSGTLYNNSN